MTKSFSFATLILLFAFLPFLWAGTEISPDGNTVLLDHYNGSTKANNNYPAGTVSFTASLPGLGQALDFPVSYNLRYDLQSWYYGSGGEGTVELLIKRTANEMFLPVVFQWYRADYPPGWGGWIGYFRVYQDGRFSWWEWGSPSPIPELFCNKKIPLNQWTYIAVTWGSDGTKIFFNGEQEGYVNAAMGPFMLSNVYIYVSAHANSACLDELHISKIQRSDQEIREHAQQLLMSDTTPPEISVSVSPSRLWPPNHKMVTIHADVVVTDDYDPNPTWKLLSITSNEPEAGLGKKNSPDIMGHEIGTPDTEFQLRAERLGTGTGRVYTIIYEATDAAGNSATAEVQVVVPHDLGKRFPSPDGADQSAPLTFKLEQNYPNPFNAETHINFQIAEARRVTIAVYDVNGRMVRSLYAGLLERGNHSVIWDSRDNFQRDVPSGVYFVRMNADGLFATKKIILIR